MRFFSVLDASYRTRNDGVYKDEDESEADSEKDMEEKGRRVIVVKDEEATQTVEQYRCSRVVGEHGIGGASHQSNWKSGRRPW
jgi:hypothetical protein